VLLTSSGQSEKGDTVRIEAFSTPKDQKRTLLLLAACGTLVAAAGAAGIDDNPLGVALAFLSANSLVLAFVHPWRTSKQFWRLIIASGLGFFVFAALSNLLEAAASKVGVVGSSEGFFDGVGATFFLIAILLCPAGLMLGIIGTAITSRRERQSQEDPPAA
jgi:D-alanyl-lipoteichoic acid acyltransferase DltB (MBOAT superfamily)